MVMCSNPHTPHPNSDKPMSIVFSKSPSAHTKSQITRKFNREKPKTILKIYEKNPPLLDCEKPQVQDPLKNAARKSEKSVHCKFKDFSHDPLAKPPTPVNNFQENTYWHTHTQKQSNQKMDNLFGRYLNMPLITVQQPPQIRNKK